MFDILNFKHQAKWVSSIQILHALQYDKDHKSNKKQQDSFANTIGLRNPVLADES